MSFALAIQVLAIGVLSALVPAMSRQTTPLGVSIPSGFVRHPVVTSAVRIYEALTGATTLLILISLLILPAGWLEPAFALAPLAVLGGSTGAYVWQRRRIIAAKEADRWYDGRAVGITADLTGSAPRDTGASVWPALIGVICLVATIGYGFTIYDRMPDPFPAHTGALGEPDRWVPKTPFEAFFSPGLALIVLVFILGLLWWMPRRPQRGLPDGDATAATARRAIHDHTTLVVVTWIGLILGIGASALSLLQWWSRFGTPTAITYAVMMTAAMAAVVLPVLKALPNLKQIDASARPGHDAESPDDDRHWKLGLLYINRDDPALMVPKRGGMGTTINLGHPAGMVFGVAVLMLLAWSIANGG
ncbi:DUF5808 domain-containing protein [Mobilicoccus pelagius]|uniref:DUF1648 domain-containing protein n=1 Tax=Mobilicoccus pelagius NBRC 104925 TaxID=1089455 RepID=H5UT94_9MICO|nr:DUF1648 domain-containing protein [Mobilicoccus pelagius]GAB48952.1 hypothetical protein MOPEL_087_00030 [Mobilicoccus pelagius NBRC 104925]